MAETSREDSDLSARINERITDAMRMASLGGEDAAYSQLTDALERSRSSGLRREEARALLALSHVVKWVPVQGNSFAASEQLAREARSIYEELGDRLGLARCDQALAPWAGPRARRMLEEGLRTFRELGEPAEVAWALDRLATHLSLREPDQAVRFREEAMGIYEKLGDHAGIGNVLFGLSIGAMGDRDKSRAYALRALEQYRSANRPKEVARTCMMLDDTGLPAEERIPGLEEGIRAAADTNTYIWQASMMRNLADCYAQLGRAAEAEKLRREADEISPEAPMDPEDEKAFAEALEAADPDRAANVLKEM